MQFHRTQINHSNPLHLHSYPPSRARVVTIQPFLSVWSGIRTVMHIRALGQFITGHFIALPSSLLCKLPFPRKGRDKKIGYQQHVEMNSHGWIVQRWTLQKMNCSSANIGNIIVSGCRIIHVFDKTYYGCLDLLLNTFFNPNL